MEHECPNEDQGESLIDPTMSECCRRDAEENARVEKLKASLRSVDRSMTALDIKHKVLRPPATPQQIPCDSSDSDSDDAGQPMGGIECRTLLRHESIMITPAITKGQGRSDRSLDTRLKKVDKV